MEDKNLIFDIFNEDGTSFNGLSLKKSTFSTVIMSLDDKIEGDIYYKDNDLSFTFKEYIVYNGVKFSLRIDVPPTIVKKGILEDNNELKGMTKYSLTFYHPMSILYNIPFTDVAVSSDESKYKSQDTTFYWIGTLTDFVTKINKNLQGTSFTCAMQAGFVDNVVKSDVIQFQDQKISDVLKTAYETWKVPYVVDGYNILFGKPSNEIYAEGSSTPFVFKMGQGLGFKNSDRTPKNNTVVTRIAGFGSATNIPNGYPIIQWAGEQSWKFTINNDSTAINSYPIIDSIIDGVSVKVIDHPFTRKTLMPSIYVDSVNKKVNPFANGYNKDIELVDYYDAVDDVSHTYINHINVTSPSYYKKGFDGSDKAVPDIKPTIVGAKYNNQAIDVIKSVSWVNDDQTAAISIDDTYDAQTDKYTQGYFKIEFYPLGFDLYAMASVTSAMSVNMTSGACNGCKFELAVDWDVVKTNFYYTDANNVIIFDPTNIHGTHRDYNIFPDSTSQSISVIVKKDINTFGTLMPNIYQQPKANDTFVFTGIAMPSSYIIYAQSLLDEAMKQYMKENNIAYYEYPIDFDNYFLETNTYILNQIKTNSIIRFDYANSTFALSVKDLSISWGSAALPSYKITLTDDIAIVTDPLGTVVDGLSKLGTQVAQLQTSYNINIIDELNNIIEKLNNKLSKKYDDVSTGHITFLDGISIGDGQNGIDKDGNAQLESVKSNFNSGLLDGTGFGVYTDTNGKSVAEIDKLLVRMKAIFAELEVRKLSFTAGDVGYTSAGCKVTKVSKQSNGDYRCYFLAESDGVKISNDWHVGDQAMCRTSNIISKDTQIAQNRYYWRLVVRIGEEELEDGKSYYFIDLSDTSGTLTLDGYENPCVGYDTSVKIDGRVKNDAPQAEDSLVQLGSQTDPTRRYAYIIYVTEQKRVDYDGINDYDLDSHIVEIHSSVGTVVHSDRFSIVSSSGTGVSKPIVCERGQWTAGMVCGHYDHVSYNNATWLCNVGKGETTTDEPTDGSTVWIKETYGANGQTSYLHIAYATSADGSQGFDVSVSTGKTYIGQYVDFTQADSTDYTKYSWTLIKGTDGINAINGVLTNDSVTLPANSSGVVSDFSTATGTFKVWNGSTDITGKSVTYDRSASGCSGTINTAGVYSVTAMSANIGTLTLTATYNGVTITRIFSVSKAIAGLNGNDSVIYNIIPSVYCITKSVTNNFTPSSVTFAFYKTTGSTTIAYTGYYKTYYSTDGTSYTLITSSSGSSASITPSSTYKSVKCELYTDSAYTNKVDYQTVLIVSDGTNGTNGNDAVSYKLVPVTELANVQGPKAGDDIIVNVSYNIQKSVGTTVSNITDLSTEGMALNLIAGSQNYPLTWKDSVFQTSATWVFATNTQESVVVALTRGSDILDRRVIPVRYLTSVTRNTDSALGLITDEVKNARGQSATLQIELQSIKTTVTDKVSTSTFKQTSDSFSLSIARNTGNLIWYSGFQPLANYSDRPNSGFNPVGAKYFSIDTTKVKFSGVPSLKYIVSGLSQEARVGTWWASVDVVGLKDYTLSFYLLSDDLSTIDGTVYCDIITHDANGNTLNTTYQSGGTLKPTAANQWFFNSRSFTTPANAAKIDVVIGLSKNGRLWLSCPNLVEGAVAETGPLLAKGEEFLSASFSSGIARNTGNLIWYSGFTPLASANDRPNSGVNGDMTVFHIDNTTVKFAGVPTLLIEATGQTSNIYATFKAVNVPIKPNTTYTLSSYSFSNAIATIDNKAFSEIRTFDKNLVEISTNYSYQEITPTANNQWLFHTRSFTTPANAATITINIGLIRNGRLWLSCPNLVEGTVAETGPLLAKGEELLPTGINIQNKTINLNADKTNINGTDGTKIAVFDIIDGKPRLRTELISTNLLELSTLIARDPSENMIASVNANGTGEYIQYYPTGGKKMEFNNGNIIYYNADGTMKWRIGEAGTFEQTITVWNPIYLALTSEDGTGDGVTGGINVLFRGEPVTNLYKYFSANSGNVLYSYNGLTVVNSVSDSTNPSNVQTSSYISDGWYAKNVSAKPTQPESVLYKRTIYRYANGKQVESEDLLF